MTAAKAIAYRAAAWEADQVEHTADTRLILDLYDREQLSLRRYLVYLGVDVATAEETVQESFLKLHQHLLADGDRTHLRAWLYRVAHNLARNAQTSSRATKTNSLSDSRAVIEPIAIAASAEESMLERERERRLQSAIGRLSSTQRNCLVLRSQGLKYREIAEALSLSVSTVAENVQRGLEKVKEAL